MIDPALPDPVAPARWTAERYLHLVDDGVLGPDDRVELLEGVIVSMAPQNVRHAAAVARVTRSLTLALADRALVRPQLAFLAGPYSVPEPDVAVVAGGAGASDHAHPRDAALVVEVRRDPEPASRRYRSVAIRRRGDQIELLAFPGVRVRVDELLPDGVG